MRRRPITKVFLFSLIDILIGVFIEITVERILKVLWGRIRKMRLTGKRRRFMDQFQSLYFNLLSWVFDISEEEILVLWRKTNRFKSIKLLVQKPARQTENQLFVLKGKP